MITATEDAPNFATWNRKVLEEFAKDAYIKMTRDHYAMEQLRLDNKDLSEQVRKLLTNKDDWK